MGRTALRVAVVGGSLGGLNVGLWLRRVGCDVTVYERSARLLEGRGVGIVLHPATVRVLVSHGVPLRSFATAVCRTRYVGRDGDVVAEHPCRFWFASYSSLYRACLGLFGRERYRLGKEAVGYEEGSKGVRVRFADGEEEFVDLLVWADGIRSTGRPLVAGGVSWVYAGYVAWRGTVREEELAVGDFEWFSEAVTYAMLQPGHILIYPISRADAGEGAGAELNWVWYWNVGAKELDDFMTDREGRRQPVSVPPGMVRDELVAELRERAREELGGPLGEVVVRTERPFLQLICDITVDRMASRRACLVGDAAFVARPHVAAGTAKAAEDAWQLSRWLSDLGGDVDVALQCWEPRQRALGESVVARSRDVGEQMQLKGSWPVGAPLPYGLYESGDSEFDEGDVKVADWRAPAPADSCVDERARDLEAGR